MRRHQALVDEAPWLGYGGGWRAGHLPTMKTFATLVRWCCMAGGLIGLVACTWAFIDPGAFPQPQAGGWIDPPSPRWRAAFGFVFSLALLGYGSGRLRHRELP